jgi:prevent-host-death family protein
MATHEPTTRTISADEAGKSWGHLLDEVAQTSARVIVERDGKPVAAVVSPADLRRLARLDARRERAFDVIRRMEAAFEGVPYEEIEREAAKALAEVRAEMRAEREQTARAAES